MTSAGHHRDGRPRTPVRRTKSGGITGDSIMRTPGSSSDFRLEVGMSVFCSNELGGHKASNDFCLATSFFLLMTALALLLMEESKAIKANSLANTINLAVHPSSCL